MIDHSTIDIVQAYRLPYTARKEVTNASILHEVPCQKGNEGCKKHNHEEREASDSGCVPDMWHQDVQNRKELRPILDMS